MPAKIKIFMNIKTNTLIIDSKFLPLIELAEMGDTEAIWDLACAFTSGVGAKRDKNLFHYYLLKLVSLPERLTKYQYGGVLSALGDVTFDLRNYAQAADWYMKAIQHFRENFTKDEAQELMDYYEVEISLEDAFYWSDKIKELLPEMPK